MAHTKNHSLNHFYFDIFGQEVGIEGTVKLHLWCTLLVKGWVVVRYFG